MSDAEDLTGISCEPCRGGVDPMNSKEIEEYRAQTPDWDVVSEDGVDQLRREFRFPDYPSAMQFTNQVAELAEREDHHPSLLLEWGKVTVHWWTHKIGGLHLNDFVAAFKTDLIASERDDNAT